MTVIPPTALPGNPQCSRYRVDGTKCPNHTAQPDGWCRAQDCDGYRTAKPLAREKPSAMPRGHGSPPARETIARPDAHVTITARAVREFVQAHGGPQEHARVEIRAMLDQMWQHGRARSIGGGRHILYLAGFAATLSREGDAVIEYRTVHDERSYAQVDAGVRSRSKRSPSRMRRDRVLNRVEPQQGFEHEDPYDAVADWV